MNLVDEIEQTLADHIDQASLGFTARAVLDVIRDPVVAMFRAVGNPNLPKLTPEQYWEALVKEVEYDDDD